MMNTPFDRVIEHIGKVRYHNHRQEMHSDIVSRGVLSDLRAMCPALDADLDAGAVQHWLNVSDPGKRGRRIDLLVGEPDAETGGPNIAKARICMENKSVATAHRNKDARFDDLQRLMLDILQIQPDVVLVGTVLVGTASQVLNVPDGVKKEFKSRQKEFVHKVLPRLSSGDETLWEEFAGHVSPNRPGDPEKTAARFRELPVRNIARTHVQGYDALLIVPVNIDNVNPPAVDRSGRLVENGVDADYQAMLETICRAYRARWHS